MARKPASREPRTEEENAREDRHRQFPQESWTEIDAEGSDSETAEGREATEPFYTPLVTEAAERRLKKEREERARRGETGEKM